MKSITVKKRVGWLDVGKGICMIFVLMSHMEWRPFIYSQIFTPVFLSFFFFASGYVFKIQDSFKKFLLHKAKGLLIPLFALSSICILLSSIISVSEHSLTKDFAGLFLQIRGKNDFMWFVASTFTAEIVFYFIIKNIKKERNLIITTLIMCIASMAYDKLGLPPLPWHIQVIGIANFFLALGWLYKNKYEEIYKDYTSKKMLLISLFSYIVVLFIKISVLKDYKCIRINNYSDNLIMWFIVTFISMWFFIELFKFINSNKLLEFIGRNTLIFFAFHIKFQRIFEKVIEKINISFVGFNSYWLVILCVIFEVTFLCIGSCIINRYFPFLLGKNIDKVNFKNIGLKENSTS